MFHLVVEKQISSGIFMTDANIFHLIVQSAIPPVEEWNTQEHANMPLNRDFPFQTFEIVVLVSF